LDYRPKTAPELCSLFAQEAYFSGISKKTPSKPGFYIEKQPAAIDRNHISVKLTQNNPKKQKLEISHLRTYNTKGRYFSDLRKTNCLDTFK